MNDLLHPHRLLDGLCHNILANLFSKIHRPFACCFQILDNFRRVFFTGCNLSLSNFDKRYISLW
jgi:hypothetical protein